MDSRSVATNGLSAVVICLNAERHIKKVIAALKKCDEILVLDNGSTDRTIEMIEHLPSVRVERSKFIGFGPTKKHAVNLATFDWILSIDADEIIDDALIDECRNIIATQNIKSIGRIQRVNYLLGRRINYSGWGNDYLLRFFNKVHTNFNDKPVHESLVRFQDSRIVEFDNNIHHHPIDKPQQMVIKSLHYSTLRESRAKPTKELSILYAVIASTLRFFKTYIVQMGLLDGWYGLLIAIANAQGVFWRHIQIKSTLNEED